MLNIFCYVMPPLLISLRDIYCFHTGKLLSLSDNLPFPYRIVSVWHIYYFLMGYLIFPCGRFTLSWRDIYSFFIWYLLFPHEIFLYQIFTFPDGTLTFSLRDIYSFPTGYLLSLWDIILPWWWRASVWVLLHCVLRVKSSLLAWSRHEPASSPAFHGLVVIFI